ncbi:MAG: CDP-glycerol glycerophosphotransferase family protein [Lachnospiraceae bacterium]|nr:CDP-glycerol glycerophosphotransferase family protein [Lachnospiraceae bacterium]
MSGSNRKTQDDTEIPAKTEYLKSLSDDEIIDKIGMAEMPLVIYFLSLKYETDPILIPIENDIMIRVGECNAANLSYLAVYIHFFEFNKGCLTIEGHTSFPSVLGDFTFKAYESGHLLSVEMYEAGFDLSYEDVVYEKRTAFKINIMLSENTVIHFSNEVNGLEAEYGRINSMRFSPIADCIKEQFFAKDGWIFFIEENHIVCKKADEEYIITKEKKFREEIKNSFPDRSEWVNELRDFYYDKINRKSRPIWLFMDRPDMADDSAGTLFEYASALNEADCFFLISEDSRDFNELSKIGKVIPLYSKEHYKLSLVADYIISSQCNGVVENPFWDDAEFFRDLYHRPKIIFLQHGVIKDDMSPTLERFNTNFTGFVTSTKDEYKSVLDYPYHYTEKEVWFTGLPRYDRLYDDRKKIILIMPSWRKSLMEQVWDEKHHTMRWVMKKDFKKSDFYKKYKSLLTNRQLLRKCRKLGFKICFMAHPLMKGYFDELKRDGVEIWNYTKTYRDAFAQGALLVTDYSSVAFDFAYLRKPVIYYHFDKESFYKEHTYKKGYFDYTRDGLGEVCLKEKDLLVLLNDYLKNDFELKQSYRDRIEKLWLFEGDYCKRVYEKIKELQNDRAVNQNNI